MNARLLLSTSLLALVSACSAGSKPAQVTPDDGLPGDTQNPGDGQTPGEDIARSSQTRDLSPDVSAEDATALRDGNTTFATDLYATLRTGELEGKNVFFSPHSISSAVAMAYAGARGATESQIKAGLHFTLPQEKLHPALNALDLALSSRAAGETPYKLNVVNSLWGAKGFPFLDSYLDTLATNYGAGVRLTDFLGDADGSRATINQWVEQQTNEKIVDLLPEGSITRDTAFVLVNAVYFNGTWDRPFEESATKPATFHGAHGDTSVPTMHLAESYLRYAEGEGWKAVELTFAGGQAAFDVVVPESIDAFDATLDGAKVAAVTSALAQERILLAMPKFKLEKQGFNLKDALENLGVVDAFDGGKADFSGISTERATYLSKAFHQAFVDVSEKGVEAAAATALIGEPSSVPPTPKAFDVDKPFVFFIRDVQTGAILFLGRVLDL